MKAKEGRGWRMALTKLQANMTVTLPRQFIERTNLYPGDILLCAWDGELRIFPLHRQAMPGIPDEITKKQLAEAREKREETEGQDL